MSQRVFGKPAKDLYACRERAHRRPGSRTGGVVAVVEPRWRGRAQPRRARAHARRAASSPRPRSRTRGARRSRSAVSQRQRRPRTATRRTICASGSATSSAATIRPTGASTRRSSPALQDAAERAVENGLGAHRQADLQAALVAIDPADRQRAGARRRPRLSRARPFNRASRSRRQPGSAFKPFVFAAALERGLSPVSTLTGLDAHRAAGAGRMDAEERRAAMRRTS